MQYKDKYISYTASSDLKVHKNTTQVSEIATTVCFGRRLTQFSNDWYSSSLGGAVTLVATPHVCTSLKNSTL